MPSLPIERGKPGPGLVAHVLIAKYCDHLPLYRQSEIYDREGIDLSRSTMADWIGKASALLEPLLVKLENMRSQAIDFMAMTHLFLCWNLEGARPGSADSGLMFATAAPMVTRHHRQSVTSSVRIVRGNIPGNIWPPSPAYCMPTVMRASAISTNHKSPVARRPLWRPPAGRMQDASSLI